MTTVTDVERVRNMLAEGKISASEAERLIAVLEEVDAVERDLEAVGNEADRVSADPPAPPADGSHDRQPTRDATVPGRWVLVSMLAGDLDVRLDDGIVEPVVAASDGSGPEVEVVPDGDGFRISQFPAGKDFFDRLLGGLRRGDLDIRLPPGFNLRLDVKAGDITVRDVPFLAGRLLAGDLDASGLQGIDLTMQAGDVDLDLAPTTGRHRVRVSAGDVTVRLQPQSSVQVEGRVSIGEARIAGSAAERSGLGASFATTVGAGAATLDLQLSTGQLSVEVHDE